MPNYTGITIGPIYETMQLSNKLDSVWLSSYLFSMFSKMMIEELEKKHTVIFPCYDKNKHIPCFERGIGLFDDRIILLDAIDKNEIIKVKYIVCEKISEFFDRVNGLTKKEAGEILKQYIQLGIVYKEVLTDKNIINEFDSEFAIADLDRHIVDNSLSEPFDKFKQIFSSGKKYKVEQGYFYNHSEYIRKIKMNKSANHYKIKAIFDHNDPESKTKKASWYYACICADGDNFSKYLDTIKGDNQKLSQFSRNCFDFNCDVSDMINDYGGFSIFQGGDDIFCLLPIKFNDQKNVFDFSLKLQDAFNKYFANCEFYDNKNGKDIKQRVSLSVAVSFRYYKYSINEAWNETTDLLYSEIKSSIPNKNSTLFNLQKHSGQVYNLVFNNDDPNFRSAVDIFSNSLNPAMKTSDKKELNSIKNNIFTFEDLIKISLDNQKHNNTYYIDNLFNNIYDNGPNSYIVNLLDVIKKYIYKYYSNNGKYCRRGVLGAIGILGILSLLEDERGRG